MSDLPAFVIERAYSDTFRVLGLVVDVYAEAAVFKSQRDAAVFIKAMTGGAS